jgi:hypothetical protein
VAVTREPHDAQEGLFECMVMPFPVIEQHKFTTTKKRY